VLSTISNRHFLPIQQLSGAGHGAGVLPVGNAPQRSSWQTTLESILVVESRPSITALEAFPAPPSQNKENEVPGQMAKLGKASLRVVAPSSEASESREIQKTTEAYGKSERSLRGSGTILEFWLCS
jgi:hypothetical protein